MKAVIAERQHSNDAVLLVSCGEDTSILGCLSGVPERFQSQHIIAVFCVISCHSKKARRVSSRALYLKYSMTTLERTKGFGDELISNARMRNLQCEC